MKADSNSITISRAEDSSMRLTSQTFDFTEGSITFNVVGSPVIIPEVVSADLAWVKFSRSYAKTLAYVAHPFSLIVEYSDGRVLEIWTGTISATGFAS